MPSFHPRRQAARRLVLTALLVVPLLVVGLDLCLDRLLPHWEDPERAVLLSRLRDRVAEQPHRPLRLVLGSSRATNAFDGRWLSESDPHGPLVVNVSLVGSSPFTSLLTLRRVVAEGYRPRSLVLEVLPSYLQNPLITPQGQPPELHRLRLADWPLLYRLHPEHSLGLTWYMAEARTARCLRHRAELMARIWPRLAPPDRVRFRAHQEASIDSHGWHSFRMDPVPTEIAKRGFEVARTVYEPALREMRPPSPVFARVMKELFAFCHEQKITVEAVLFMPESSAFRGFYGPGVESGLSEIVSSVCEQHGVRFLDARDWCPDDVFIDGHHLTARGSRLFLERLRREQDRSRN